MRFLALVAALIAALMLMVRFEAWSRWARQERELHEQSYSDHTLRIYAQGHGMEPAVAGHRKHWQGIFLDERLYRADPTQSGLRVLVLLPGRTEPVMASYDVADSSEAVKQLLTMAQQLPVDAILAMGSYRDICPSPKLEPERHEIVARLLRGLGARSEPLSAPSVAFAYLCVRRPQGFVPIAETLSSRRGIELSYHLDADLSVYDDRPPRTLIDQRQVFPLSFDLVADLDVPVAPLRRLHGIGHRSVLVRASHDEPVSLKWSAPGPVPIDAGTIVKTHIGLRSFKDDTIRGVRFVMRVNGEEVSSRIALGDEKEFGSWFTWEVVLDPSVKRLSDLEIEVVRLGDAGLPTAAYVAEPSLHFGRSQTI